MKIFKIKYNRIVNIFVVDLNPRQAARDLCNAHCVKMTLETAQLLCSAYDEGTQTPYKKTHVNHPCARWVRESKSNFEWLSEHGLELSAEYTRRYGKRHASQDVIEQCVANPPRLVDIGLTSFAQAVPEIHKADDVVQAYRSYYKAEKARFAIWEPRAREPKWWISES